MNKHMYIDWITLLPPPATTTGNETNLKDKKPATIESFDHWLEAWSAHEKTYLTNPARYAALAQYHSIIQKANWKFRLKAVYDFVVQFRMSLSGTTKRLDQIDSTLYTTILDSSVVRAEGTSCQHCKSDHHLACLQGLLEGPRNGRLQTHFSFLTPHLTLPLGGLPCMISPISHVLTI